MDIGGGGNRLAARTGLSSGYGSAEPARRRARPAVRLAVFLGTIQFVLALVAAALIGWALTMDPAGAAVPVERMRVSAPVQQMVSTAVRLSTGAGIAFAVTVLLAAIGVIRWQTRALQNLPALGLPAPRRPAWRAGLAWFVPGWGLLAVQQTLDELWRSGEPPHRGDPEADPRDRVEMPGFLSLWWGLWVLGQVGAAALLVSVGRDDGSARGLLGQQLISGAVALIWLGAGLLLPRVLGQTTARQDARHARLSSAADR